jgi:hypothetical protein
MGAGSVIGVFGGGGLRSRGDATEYPLIFAQKMPLCYRPDRAFFLPEGLKFSIGIGKLIWIPLFESGKRLEGYSAFRFVLIWRELVEDYCSLDDLLDLVLHGPGFRNTICAIYILMCSMGKVITPGKFNRKCFYDDNTD